MEHAAAVAEEQLVVVERWEPVAAGEWRCCSSQMPTAGRVAAGRQERESR